MKKANKNSGITIVETLIYSGILLIVLVFIVQTVISLTQSHRRVKLTQTIESSGALAMERILREVRNSSEVVLADSVFDTSPGTLKLSGTDEIGNAYTLTFDVGGGAIRVAKDSGAAGALTSNGITVTSLIFKRISNSNSEAIKVEMSLSGTSGDITKQFDLFGSAVVRN